MSGIHPAALERRERVAELTLAGWSGAEIAEELGITRRSVVRNRAAAGVHPPTDEAGDDWASYYWTRHLAGFVSMQPGTYPDTITLAEYHANQAA